MQESRKDSALPISADDRIFLQIDPERDYHLIKHNPRWVTEPSVVLIYGNLPSHAFLIEEGPWFALKKLNVEHMVLSNKRYIQFLFAHMNEDAHTHLILQFGFVDEWEKYLDWK